MSDSADTPEIDNQYQLQDRYVKSAGRVYLTGTQALVRLILDQSRRDRAAGLSTAGFVSGYRGSPLGAVDLELWRAKHLLRQAKVEFLPAVNEDLAATAVLGSQQVEGYPDKQVDGVFGLWYGKGPGVDRSGDALKHGNAYGCSPTGGVLVVVGDDHGCVSSSMPHQSDVALMSWFMPVLNPANIDEYQAFGEYGYALSRFSGMWVGFKAISETVESAASVDIQPDRKFEQPDFVTPEGGLHYRWPDLPGPQIEERLEAKKEAVFAFAARNPIDRHIYKVDKAVFGIVTTGKGHLDLMEALRLLGVDETVCRDLGIDIYKVGMVWPLARADALDFVRGKREVLVVEEKRGIIESQFKEYFYDYPGDKPERMVGKRDERGERLVPWTGELSPRLLVPLVAQRLALHFPDQGFLDRAQAIGDAAVISLQVAGATRTPYFCSGCPHNSSTKVPEGSQALAGIGCHFMASWMDRDTTSLIQMGGEGVNWAASSRFTKRKHVFQNLGEGTYYHSGSMAIRQAIAANATITYKILFNDAVAMTGGQPVDGPVSVQAIAHEVRAEGVHRIELVSDEPDKFDLRDFPAQLGLHHRRDLDRVQRELREVEGVSVLIYEQTCATEKRRRRKRGLMADPAKHVVINDLVCEGCGDCSVESNCLSIEPRETPLGRKRQVNLSNCNKDFSCVNGFCPSFVTVEGGERRRGEGVEQDFIALADALALPETPDIQNPYDLLITGVGGTGVVTVGALITMAAHLENKGATVLDFTGFAQKFGPVLSYIRLGQSPDALHQVRIDELSADALIGCDVVVSSSPKASKSYRPGMRVVLNTAQMPTGDLVRVRDASLNADQRVASIAQAIGTEHFPQVDANRMAEQLLGDAVFANIIMLGLAWQAGLIPVSLAALKRAIELNGVAIEKNHRAFACGRLAFADPDSLRQLQTPASKRDETLDQLINRRSEFLREYQDQAYANRYVEKVERVRASALGQRDEAVTRAVARSLFKLMAYKDEYEVARLHTSAAFRQQIESKFKGDYKLKYHLAPPLISFKKDGRGRPLKREMGAWMTPVFSRLASWKTLRGSRWDLFGYTAERKMERELITWYEGLIDRCLASTVSGATEPVVEILAMPMDIRGYGPVKEQAVATVKAKLERSLTELDSCRRSQSTLG
ncbi:MAG: indolepyruvate ferredoxin oxidoreductase family protein [Granulosicoccaceae bacterium]